MVKNEVVNYLKHEKRQVRMPEIPDDAGLDLSMKNLLKQRELQEQMIMAISNLPEWWNKHTGITFNRDFFFHPLKRIESEQKMERFLY